MTYRIIFILALFSLAQAETRISKLITSAPPALGFDHYLELHPDSVYTGGAQIHDLRVSIRANGALIDLQGDSIVVDGIGQLQIDRAVIRNGYFAVIARDLAGLFISNCTLTENYTAVITRFHSGLLQVINSIVAFNSHWGIAKDVPTRAHFSYNLTWMNPDGDYMERCPT